MLIVRLLKDVRSGMPDSRLELYQGEIVEAIANQHGAVSAKMRCGRLLGLVPSEFEVLCGSVEESEQASCRIAMEARARSRIVDARMVSGASEEGYDMVGHCTLMYRRSPVNLTDLDDPVRGRAGIGLRKTAG